MPQKIHRRGPRVFHKRKTGPIKVIVTILLCAVLVTGGYFMAKYMMETGLRPADGDSSTAPTTSGSAQPTTPVTKPAVPPADTGKRRALYATLAQLKDRTALDALLDKAAGAGFNAVLFDLKDAAGSLWYTSATTLAVQAATPADGALTLDELRSLASHLREKGFAPIPRLYAFRDATAPIRLASAKVTLQGDPGLTWLDNAKAKGGKPWLNPYAPDAHRYVLDLVAELGGAGFDILLLDGVQFPEQESQAYYGTSELTALSRSAVLQKFVSDAVAAAPDTAIWLAAPGLAVFGDATAPYGGNPLTFGAAVTVPNLTPSTLGKKLVAGEETLSAPADHPYEAVQLALAQAQRRAALIEADKRPVLAPFLAAKGLPATALKDALRALKEGMGDDLSFLLYDETGTYDLDALAGVFS